MAAHSADPVSNRTIPEAGSSIQTDTLAKYRTLLDSATIPQNTELSHWFWGLQTCDYFRQMPESDLLVFARELANSIDNQYMQAKIDDLKPWAPRMLHLTKIIEENASISALDVKEEVIALVARAHAFEGSFEKAKEYLSQRMESEGRRKVNSHDNFSKSHFQQVLTSLVLFLDKYGFYHFSIVYLFESSRLRWKNTKMGIDKFLVDKKLDQLLRRIVDPNVFRFFVDWLKAHYHAKKKVKHMILDFLLASLNGNGHHQGAKDFIMGMHAIGKSCSGTLVVETIRGLLSECNGTPDYLILKKITAVPQHGAPNIIPASGTKKKPPSPPIQAGSESLNSCSSRLSRPIKAKKRSSSPVAVPLEAPDTCPPSFDNKPPKKRSRQDK